MSSSAVRSMSNVKLEAIDKKLQDDLARLQTDYERRLAALNDINNDPALEPPVQLETGALPRACQCARVGRGPLSRTPNRDCAAAVCAHPPPTLKAQACHARARGHCEAHLHDGFCSHASRACFFLLRCTSLTVAPFSPGYTSCVVVDCIPIVDEVRAVPWRVSLVVVATELSHSSGCLQAMVGKLRQVLVKIASKCGKIAEDDVYLPVDPATKKTLGFCILHYATDDEAKTALKSLDNLKLDQKHTFKVLPYAALEAADKTPADYVVPDVLIPDKPNLLHWLLDSRGTDQYLLHYDRKQAHTVASLCVGVFSLTRRRRLSQARWTSTGTPSTIS